MALLEDTCAAVVSITEEAARAAQQRLDAKTKPRRSLGRLEDLACQLAGIYGTANPHLPAKAVVVMAADHGVADEGVSAYPAEVTCQMVQNFAGGGAAINVLARQAGAGVIVVDMGTKSPIHVEGVLDRRLGPGTANFSRGPAMSRAVAVRAIESGIQLAFDLSAGGIGLIAVGDMGIGNTTAASAVTAVLTGTASHQVTGHGTGIDEARRKLKVDIIERGLDINQPDPRDPVDVLARVGGFEIGGLAGAMIGAAARRVPVVVDGFITAAAALIAAGLCPRLRDYLIAGHQSVEPGHAVILRSLNLRPLLDLDLRLGEGTGAVLAMHLIEAALRILREMATFADAGVTDAGA
jgi:nicotinate-nucleotide--dimethylbenzimidazole phosphoribosyltransferase